MAIDRSKFRATNVRAIKEAAEKEDSIIGAKSNGFLRIEEGKKNTFRLFPAREGESNFMAVSCRHWLPVKRDDGKDGKTTVFNAKIHGGHKMDVCEEYIKYVTENADNLGLDAALVKKLTDYQGGVSAQTKWVMYALCLTPGTVETIGLLEIGKSVRDKIIKDATAFEEENDSDPFTDVDTGVNIVITYDKKASASNMYGISSGRKAVPLSDEQLEEWLEKKSLTELYVNNYTKDDFDRAVEGLKYFDEINKIGAFDEDDFLQKVEECAAQFSTARKAAKTTKPEPEPKKTKPEPKGLFKKAAPEPEPEDEDDEDADSDDSADGDEFDSMDRSELKEHIKGIKPDFAFKKSHSEDDLREVARSLQSSESEDETEDEDDDVPPPPPPKKSGSAVLDNIKSKLAGGKK